MFRVRNPRTVFTVVGVGFEVSLWIFYVAAIVWYTVDLDLGPVRLVLLGTVLVATVLIAEVPTGVVADRFSRKWSTVASFVLVGMATLLHVATTNYGVILISQAMWGFGWTFQSGADVAWLTDEIAARQAGSDRGPKPDHADLILRRHRIGLSLSTIALVPVIVFGENNLRFIIALTGVSLLATGAWAAWTMSDHYRVAELHNPDRDRSDEPSMRQIFSLGVSTVRRVRSLRLLVVTMVLLGTGSEVLDRLGIAEFIRDGDFAEDSLRWTGVLFVALTCLGAVAVWAVERALDRGTPLIGLAAGLLFGASAGAAVAAFAPALGIAIGFLIQDPCRESLDPVMTGWANREAPDSARATVLSLVHQAHGAGEVFGGVALAALAEVFGVRPIIFVAAVLWMIAAIVASRSRS